jgi:hypothetical protein
MDASPCATTPSPSSNPTPTPSHGNVSSLHCIPHGGHHYRFRHLLVHFPPPPPRRTFPPLPAHRLPTRAVAASTILQARLPRRRGFWGGAFRAASGQGCVVGARGAPGGAAARGAARDRAGRGGDSAALVQGPGIRHRESIPRRGRIHRRPPQRQAHPGVSRSIIICSTEFLTEHMVTYY